MTALPAISTALPSLGGPGGPSASSRRSGAPASQSSPLARSGSMRSSFSSPNQQQQQQQTSVGNLASPAGRSSRNSSSTSGSIGATRGSDAVASITDDILMHHVVPIIKARNMEGFLLWLKEAPNVNIQDFAGNTPLHWACHKGLPEFVAVLLRHEALKDAANRNGATPLHCAAISGVRAVVEILLQAGADPMIRNSHGRSFFDVLRSKGHAHLLEVFEQLELKLLAREAPAQSTMADSWLDASRVGADSDSDDDGNRSHHDATPSRLPPIHQNRKLSSSALNASSINATSPALAMSNVQLSHNQPHQLEEPLHRRNGSHYRVVTIAGGNGGVSGAAPSDIERRIRALEELGASANPANSARLHVSPPLLELETSQTSAPHSGVPLTHHGVPNVYFSHPHHDQRHTVPPSGGGGVSPSNASVGTAGKMVLSGNATPRHSSSPQRYIGPSGRILCSLCDEGSRAVATGYCEECRRDGEECWFCDKCWKGEHASKRNRQHRKGPVPIPSGSSVTPRASFLHHAGDAMMDLLPFDTAALNPEARAYLMLQQQLIAAFTKANGGNVTAIRQLEPAETDDAGTQTVERIQSTYFDEAMVELQDVREQLEAEVYHSQVLIDSTRVQLLEALELRHRAEIETMCWRKYLTVKRPPQVVVLYDPSFIPPALEGLLQQKSGAPTTIAKMAMSGSSVVRTNSPPNVHITSPPVRKRNATNSQGVQCRLPPTASHATTNTEHSGDEPAPVKSVEEGSFKPRYTEDAVELVHGEKHLPDQPQMLLVRWRHGGLESWIPAYEVAHCGAVIAYLSRYDKTLVQNEAEDQQGGTDDATGSALQNRHSSPLAESERSKFAEELAALKRTGTATGSRESTDQQILPSNTQRVPQRQRPVNVPQKGTGTVEPSVQRPPLAPPAPSSRNVVVEEDASISLVEEERRDTPSDEELVRKYEQRLKDLESKQQRLQKLREDQAGRLSDLKNKQKLLDEHAREDVRRQYEAKQVQLQEQQPEQPHPLAATNDKHAALVLQELQQEVQDAERSKRRAVHLANASPPLRHNKQPDLKPHQGHEEKDDRRKPSIPPPPPAPTPVVVSDGPSFEQKINRILYEQYFYNKAQTNVSPKSPRPASLN